MSARMMRVLLFACIVDSIVAETTNSSVRGPPVIKGFWTTVAVLVFIGAIYCVWKKFSRQVPGCEHKDLREQLVRSTDLEKRLMETEAIDPPMNPDQVRHRLVESGESAVLALSCAALKHTSDTVTNMDQKLAKVWNCLRHVNKDSRAALVDNVTTVGKDCLKWACQHPLKTICLLGGLGGTAFKAKTIAAWMKDHAQLYTEWSLSATTPVRFGGFVLLMTMRLVISTLVPPTSPAFGIIIQAATPESQKWTAMIAFLAASTIAGAVPFVLDKALQACLKKDFQFTFAAKSFTDNWPLTCWTGPTMRRVFDQVGGGKHGASVAVIVAHAAPFMGAQTTIMQRFYLPHALDAIISQPFGMSEDLISMAMAEASSNPMLGSVSLTCLLCSFNLMQFFVFSNRESKALVAASSNVIIGIVAANWLSSYNGGRGLVLVGMQSTIQLLAVPVLSGFLLRKGPSFAVSSLRMASVWMILMTLLMVPFTLVTGYCENSDEVAGGVAVANPVNLYVLVLAAACFMFHREYMAYQDILALRRHVLKSDDQEHAVPDQELFREYIKLWSWRGQACRSVVVFAQNVTTAIFVSKTLVGLDCYFGHHTADKWLQSGAVAGMMPLRYFIWTLMVLSLGLVLTSAMNTNNKWSIPDAQSLVADSGRLARQLSARLVLMLLCCGLTLYVQANLFLIRQTLELDLRFITFTLSLSTLMMVVTLTALDRIKHVVAFAQKAADSHEKVITDEAVTQVQQMKNDIARTHRVYSLTRVIAVAGIGWLLVLLLKVLSRISFVDHTAEGVVDTIGYGIITLKRILVSV